MQLFLKKIHTLILKQVKNIALLVDIVVKLYALIFKDLWYFIQLCNCRFVLRTIPSKITSVEFPPFCPGCRFSVPQYLR